MHPVIEYTKFWTKTTTISWPILILKKEYYSKRISGSTSVTVELLGKRFNCKLL
jgi:hypothetical protein